MTFDPDLLKKTVKKSRLVNWFYIGDYVGWENFVMIFILFEDDFGRFSPKIRKRISPIDMYYELWCTDITWVQPP